MLSFTKISSTNLPLNQYQTHLQQVSSQMPTANVTIALPKRRVGGRDRNRNRNRSRQLYLKNLSKHAIRWILGWVGGKHISHGHWRALCLAVGGCILRDIIAHHHSLKGAFYITYPPVGCFSCVDKNKEVLFKDKSKGETSGHRVWKGIRKLGYIWGKLGVSGSAINFLQGEIGNPPWMKRYHERSHLPVWS